jgi:hypothetical protein
MTSAYALAAKIVRDVDDDEMLTNQEIVDRRLGANPAPAPQQLSPLTSFGR